MLKALYITLLGLNLHAQSILIPEGNPAVSLDDILTGARSIATDADGLIYVADTQNHVIRQYAPDGAPMALIGQVASAGRVDGSAAQARLNLPFHLRYDGDGGLLILDNRTFVRRLDIGTLTLSTLANLASGIVASNVLDVTTGTFVNRGTLNNACLGNIAAHSDGSFYVSAADSQGMWQYLLHGRGPEVVALATTSIPVTTQARMGTRGMAIDLEGNVFMQFPDGAQGGEPVEHIHRFVNGSVSHVTQHHLPVGVLSSLASGRTNQLYCMTGNDPMIDVISTTAPGSSLHTLTVTSTFPVHPSQRVRDVAVCPSGDLLAVNERTLNAAGSPCAAYSKVDLFATEDAPIGGVTGDLQKPTVTLTSPASGTVLVAMTPLTAIAEDNSGAVSAQFRVNHRDHGQVLRSAPFSTTLDPTSLPAGNLTLEAIARDATGNAGVSEPVLVHNPLGWPNLEGEIFAGDAQLNQPSGVAVAPGGDLFAADHTRVWRVSRLGEVKGCYGTTNSAMVDGDEATVRFADLRGLGVDAAGGIVMVDDGFDGVGSYGSPFIRRLDPETGLTTTLYELDVPTNNFLLSDAYSVTDGTMVPLGGPGTQWGWLEGRDVGGMPDGDLVVTVSRLSWPTLAPYQYLIRLGVNGCRILAYHSLWLLADQDARAVAVAGDGTLFASFQTASFDPTDGLFAFAPGFPGGGLSAVHTFYGSIGEVSWLTADGSNRVYVSRPARSPNPAQVAILSSTQNNTVLVSLQHGLLTNPQDLAVDSQGNVYVTCTEQRSFDGSLHTVARLVRYAAAGRVQVQPPLPPVVMTVSTQLHPFGGRRLTLRTSPGWTYEIQATENLTSAFQVAEVVKATGESLVWFDTGFGTGTSHGKTPCRFYRARCINRDVITP